MAPIPNTATFFDVEWEHPFEDFKGKILIPMLGDFFRSLHGAGRNYPRLRRRRADG